MAEVVCELHERRLGACILAQRAPTNFHSRNMGVSLIFFTRQESITVGHLVQWTCKWKPTRNCYLWADNIGQGPYISAFGQGRASELGPTGEFPPGGVMCQRESLVPCWSTEGKPSWKDVSVEIPEQDTGDTFGLGRTGTHFGTPFFRGPQIGYLGKLWNTQNARNRCGFPRFILCTPKWTRSLHTIHGHLFACAFLTLPRCGRIRGPHGISGLLRLQLLSRLFPTREGPAECSRLERSY